MVNKFYEGVINQVSSKLALCNIPDLERPIKIGSKFLKKALEGDKVLLKVKEGKYGFVQKIIERNEKILTGQIQISKGYAFIKPWNGNYYTDFFVDKKYINNAKNGDVVDFELLDWKGSDRSPNAKVIKSIYNASDTQYMMYKMDLPRKFPSVVMDELKDITLTSSDFVGREDLRELDVYSIDPKGCTDADDALSLENLEDGYRVGIHIADVSHFIKPGSQLDKEAFNRAFTIYFPDNNIPMIPSKLSSDLCSLVEGEDRLAITLFIYFDREWNIKNTNVVKSVINNNKFLTYEEAQQHKDNPNSPYFRFLNTMYTIGQKVLSEYFPNEIQLNLPELQWEFDENKNPIKIKLKKRNECMDLIQCWMLMANKLVTQIVEKYNPLTPWVYRVHDVIQDESINDLKMELVQLGEFWDDNMSQHNNIKRLLSSDNSSLISELLIRKFRPARYSSIKTGHFSLGSDDYTHFTSPIRRYTDIIIHRILLQVIKNKPIYCANLERDCEHITTQQRKVDKVERHFKNVTALNFVKDIDYSFKSKIIYFSKKGIFVKTEMLVDAWILSNELEKNGIIYSEELKKWMNPKYDWMIGDIIKTKIDKLNWIQNDILLKII